MISESLKERLEELYQSFLHDERVLKMQEFIIHRGTNCYLHSFKVTKLAIHRAIDEGLIDELETILIACVLHDYYLYSWGETHRKHHGRDHPLIASENAKRDFNIPSEVVDIINSHMWPLNKKYKPKTRAAKIVSKADKDVAFKEFMTTKKRKIRNLERDLAYISHLF